jgi:RecB family exonuclease
MGYREDGVEKVSHSMLSTFRRCPYRFQLSYLDNYSTGSSGGLARGSSGHAAMEKYYTANGDVDVEDLIAFAWDHYANQFVERGEEARPEEFELLEAALRRYVPWASENDNFTVQETEKHFVVDIGPYKLQGYIDGVVRESGHVWLLEHKFLKQVSTRHLPLDAQVSIYMLGAMQLGMEPSGVMYNMVRMSNGPTARKTPVERVRLYRNPEGLLAFAQSIVDQVDLMNHMISEDMSFYPNPTRDCGWDCSFSNVCLDRVDCGNAEATLSRMEKKEFK